MMLLTVLLILFLTGFCALLFAPKTVTLLGLTLALITVFLMYGDFSWDDMWQVQTHFAWIPVWNISFHLGTDGLAFCLTLLALTLGIIAVLLASKEKYPPIFFALLAWIMFSTVGILFAVDIFLFFVFWELALIPTYAMLYLFGGQNKKAATIKYIIFTQLSGVFLLVGILGLTYFHYKATGVLTFDYADLLITPIALSVKMFLLPAFLLAFVIKLAIFPFHGWILPFFEEAPLPLILSGVLVKTAAFGLMRFSWPIFQDTTDVFSLFIMGMGAFSVLYGAIAAFQQSNPKRIVAYGMISHAGLLCLGTVVPFPISFNGLVLLLVTQALSAAGLVIIVEHLPKANNLWETNTKLAIMLLLFCLASFGFPIFGTFIGEWMLLSGAFAKNPIITTIAASGMIASALYLLRLFHIVAFTKNFGHALPFRIGSQGVLPTLSMLALALMVTAFKPDIVLKFVQEIRVENDEQQSGDMDNEK